jgi:hypothetical protein
MVTKVGDSYRCSLCQTAHSTALLADACEQSHSVIYVPMTKEDLNSLMQFIYTGEQKVLNEDLVRKLEQYRKKNIFYT